MGNPGQVDALTGSDGRTKRAEGRVPPALATSAGPAGFSGEAVGQDDPYGGWDDQFRHAPKNGSIYLETVVNRS